MISNIVYVLATLCLLIGSSLTFDKNLPDYFFLIGTILFFINSCIRLIDEIKKPKPQPLYGLL